MRGRLTFLSASGQTCGFNPAFVEQVSWEPRVFVHSHFLSDEECEEIIQIGNATGLERSAVAGEDGQPKESEFRTSYGAFLPRKAAVLKRIEERIAEWTQIPAENGEPFYLLRYQNGQQYVPHYDFFDPEMPGMSAFLGTPGQRTATVLLYLATPIKGGETIFTNTDIKVPAIKGTAVLFYSHTPDHQLDRTSTHGGLPVEEGTKYCCTKWIRENSWYPDIDD
jgi:prolyl 4-hydroxylase